MAKSSSTSRGSSSRGRYRHTSVSSRYTSASSRRRGSISHRQQGDPAAHRRATITSRQPSIWPSSVPRPSQPTVHREEIVRQHEDGREELDHVIMALDVREQGKIGCAYYVAREERLLCMEDVPRGGVETVDRLKFDLQPTVVIVSTRADALCDQNEGWRLRRQSSLVDNYDENPPLPYQIELRPTPEFSLEGALNKLTNIGSMLAISEVKFLVPGDTVICEPDSQIDEVGLSNRQGRLLQISSWLDLDCKVSIGCVGAVMNYLQCKRVSEYLPDDPDAQLAYRIMHMEMFTFKDTMQVTTLLTGSALLILGRFVTADTLSALQIIQPESHPNSFNQGPGTTGSKESLSVFGLFQHNVRSPQGKSRLRSLFLRPSLDAKEINARLDFVSVFARPDNYEIAQRLSKSLSKIKNMRFMMALLHKGVDRNKGKPGNFNSSVWSSILEFCYHTTDIVDAIQEAAGAEQLLLRVQVTETLNKFDLQRIGRMVHEVVDTESSAEQHRTVVKRGIDIHLDQVKDVYDGIDEILSQQAIKIARLIPAEIDCHLNVIFFPQLGFHITVPFNETTGEAVWSGGEAGWEKMFNTTDQAYFKNATMREMDQDLGDLWAIVCDTEIDLAYDLAQKVLGDEKLLIAASDICGELDSLLALVHVAFEHKLTRPRLVEDNIIDIRGGRHILQEMIVPSYVPNDTRLAGGSEKRHPSMLMLTGPNHSGKSVYQKQVALIVFMAQIGSFVPADFCIVGITDKILTRISTTETVSKAHSAFMLDLQQITMALNSCTPSSLVIIDEFGKGTDLCDGAGLAAAVCHYLLGSGPQSPKVLVATHFHEIFRLGIFDDNPRISYAHMEVRVDRKESHHSNDHSSEVTYLYNLREGRSNLSYGAQCAAMNGIPREIVNRALGLANRMIHGEDLVTVCSALSENEVDELGDAEDAARAFLTQNFESDVDEDDMSVILSSILNVGSAKSMLDSRSIEVGDELPLRMHSGKA